MECYVFKMLCAVLGYTQYVRIKTLNINYSFHSKHTHVLEMLFFKPELIIVCVKIWLKHFQRVNFKYL